MSRFLLSLFVLLLVTSLPSPIVAQQRQGGGHGPGLDVQIAVVFLGDATLAVLNPDANSSEFSTEENPNLALLQQLHASGVELFVCGQSLISKGSQPEDDGEFIGTAVSALMTVVNLQTDGYANLPLGN